MSVIADSAKTFHSLKHIIILYFYVWENYFITLRLLQRFSSTNPLASKAEIIFYVFQFSVRIFKRRTHLTRFPVLCRKILSCLCKKFFHFVRRLVVARIFHKSFHLSITNLNRTAWILIYNDVLHYIKINSVIKNFLFHQISKIFCGEFAFAVLLCQNSGCNCGVYIGKMFTCDRTRRKRTKENIFIRLYAMRWGIVEYFRAWDASDYSDICSTSSLRSRNKHMKTSLPQVLFAIMRCPFMTSTIIMPGKNSFLRSS